MAMVLIVGGAAGLGGEVARAFASLGNRVLLADEAQSLPAASPNIETASVDMMAASVGADVGRLAEARLSGLDAIVLAASAMDSAPIDLWTSEMWDRALAINLRLPFLVAQHALPLLRVSANASITIMSSTAAVRGQPFTHAFQATKAGVAGLVRSLAAELGPDGIRVNGVLAGWLDTPLTRRYWAGVEDAKQAQAAIDRRIPLRRHGTAAEVAAVVCFLASPGAAYLTGAMLPVDGGDTAV